MPFKFRAFNIDDGTEETIDLDGQIFYRNRLIEAGERFNRQTTQDQRMAFWNLALEGATDTFGKFWVKTGGMSDARNKYRKLANFASEQMLKYYYQFVDTTSSDAALECNVDGETIEIFQNMVRFTVADYHNAYEHKNDAEIQVKSGSLQSTALEDNMPIRLSYESDPKFFYYVQQDKISFFVDNDYPLYYFKQNGSTWERKNLVQEGFDVNTTEVLYWIADGHINVGLISVPYRRPKGGGGGGGAMRADSINEVDYKWSGNQAYGLALGLNGEQYLGIDTLPDSGSRYIDATPYLSGKNQLQSPIKYYKRFVAVEHKKNAPRPAMEPIPSLAYNFEDAATLRKTRFFYSTDFFKLRQKGDRKEAGGPWTGLRLLHRNSRDRDNAGPTMGVALASFPYFPNEYDKWKNADIPLATSSVSATNFTDFMLSLTDVPSQWESIRKSAAGVKGIKLDSSSNGGKYTNYKNRRTDQEWCHLFGHGDGGTEEWGNFVAGSKHCNTAQLAIETGQRKWKIDNLSVKVSAYLFEQLFWIAPTTLDQFLQGVRGLPGLDDPEAAVQEIVNILNIADTNVPLAPNLFKSILIGKNDLNTLDEQDKFILLEQFFLPLPLAKIIHYKVYYNNTIAFDYHFDAQSESFDYNEFKILENMVVRAIAVTRTDNSLSQDDDEAVQDYKNYMSGKLLDLTRKGALSNDQWKKLNTSHEIDFGVPNSNGDAVVEEVDSSDDEEEVVEDQKLKRPRRPDRKRPAFSKSKKNRRKDTASSPSDDDDFDFEPTAPE